MNDARIKLFVLLLALLLAACQPAAMERTQPAPQEVLGGGLQATPAATLGSEGEEPRFEPGNPGQLAFVQNPGRMVIKDANLELLVEDTNQALSRISQLAADYGGYIISSQTWTEREALHATLRLGIPSVSFEAALTQMRNMGLEVLQETASGQDVSAEYVDLGSQLANLQATAARVRAFLEDAQTVEEALQVNDELSRLEAQIEQVQGRMRFYEGRSAFSTITVNLVPQILTPPPPPEPAWNPGQTIESAVDVLTGLARGAADFLIWAIVLVGPVGLVLLLALWILRFGLARLGR